MVDGYLAALPAESAAIVGEIRRRIHAALPQVDEIMSYQMPTFTLGGKHLVYVAAWKRHISVYPVPTGDAAFERDIAPYRAAKGTLRFPLNEPIPYDLIDRVVAQLAAGRDM